MTFHRLSPGKLTGDDGDNPFRGVTAVTAPKHCRSGVWPGCLRVAATGLRLAKRLSEMGLPETEASVQIKINPGRFQHGSYSQ
jgi:hypothetical protein